MNNLLPKTIKDARLLLEKGDISSEDITRDCLQNIEEYDSKLNAFITVNENALQDARNADIERKKGIDKPLLGIPIALKDLYSTKNLKTTTGSNVLKNYIPPYDGTVVTKLKNAGAIIIGKTNLDAWGHGASGENSDFGATKNPFDLSRTPGGSSSGSAVSVASNMALSAMGTDTGGSIRLPASFCNLVGLKPTYGRVSRYGVIAMGSSFDSIGHFSKTVYDNALILSVTAGQDVRDGTTSNKSVPDYINSIEKPFKKLKIGFVREFINEGMNNDIKKNFEESLRTLSSMGHEIIEVSIPRIPYAIATYYILITAEVSSNLNRMNGVRFGADRSHFGLEAKRRIMLGTYTLSSGYYDAYYDKALKVRQLLVRDFDEVFKKVDTIAAPISPTPPFKLGEKVNDPLQMYLSDIYTCPINLAGLPALAVPSGIVNNLPCGIQFIGRQFDEELLYNIGYLFEQERGEIKLDLKI